MSKLRSADEAIRRLEEMEAQWSGKKADPSAEAKKQAAAYNAAFWDTMHTGHTNSGLKGGSDGSGGYLVPDTYEDTLVQALADKNVIRQVATTIPTTQRMHIPLAYGMGDADWFIEGEGLTFNEASFGEVVLDAYKLATSILTSDEMLRMAALIWRNSSVGSLPSASVKQKRKPSSVATVRVNPWALSTRHLWVRFLNR